MTTIPPNAMSLPIIVNNTVVSVFFKAGLNLTYPILRKDVENFVSQIEDYVFEVLSTRYPSLASFEALNVRLCPPSGTWGYTEYYYDQGHPYRFVFDSMAGFPFGCGDRLALPTETNILTTLTRAN